MHTCIACNELKDAYKLYQVEVADKYGIKGIGHPFYEISLRNFLNYYFRNRHYADEYLDFMNGCNLSDSLLLPRYYGYFSAKAYAPNGILEGVLNAMRGTGIASPASAPYANTDPMYSYHPSKLKFFYYVDANDTAHLFADLRSAFTDERMRPYIQSLNDYIWNGITTNGWGSSSIKWSFNSLNSDYAGEAPYSYDFFLPGSNATFSTALASSAFNVISEQVTVKDGEFGNSSAQLSVPFTHYRVTPIGALNSTLLAAAWAQLDAEVATTLQSTSLGSSITLS